MLDPVVRLELFLQLRNLVAVESLGAGKDGDVWGTNQGTAVKVHARSESYRAERNAYMRFRDLDLTEIAGFSIPILLAHDDELCAFEMTTVSPPFVVDFASARLDMPDDLIEDEGHTLIDMIRERFDERAEQVIELYDELAGYAGVYLTDLHRNNVRIE